MSRTFQSTIRVLTSYSMEALLPPVPGPDSTCSSCHQTDEHHTYYVWQEPQLLGGPESHVSFPTNHLCDLGDFSLPPSPRFLHLFDTK